MNGNDIRCLFCSTHPLLAKCGVDPQSRKPFVHVKVYKQRRVYAEYVFDSGRVTILCNACGRWYEINIRENIKVKTADKPDVLKISG